MISTDPDVRAAHSEDASGLVALPDAVARPQSEEEIVELVRESVAKKIPLTPQGLRSSTVGSPLAFGGIALALQGMGRVLEVDEKRKIAVVEPGVNLGELKRLLADRGLLFPPDPTSENECTVGGAAATNASGPRSYRYGPARPWITSIRAVLGTGEAVAIARNRTTKNTTGYFGFQNPIDLLIGSEGTLGVVTELTLDLVPLPARFFAALAFFRDLPAALRFVALADGERAAGRLAPRCLELFDDASLELIRPRAGGLTIPGGARAAIFFEEESAGASEADDPELEKWLALLVRCSALVDDTIVAMTTEKQGALRRLRHTLPVEMNERGRRARDAGGGKLSTDWAVPAAAVGEMIDQASRIAQEDFGGFFVRYGHIGNGHPHFNLIAENAGQMERARGAIHRMCLTAVSLGGTVTAEHGVGKVKREYVRHQFSPWVVDAMRSLKRTLDPSGILAPGNIFEDDFRSGRGGSRNREP